MTRFKSVIANSIGDQTMANEWTQSCMDADYAVFALTKVARDLTLASINCPVVVRGEMARIKAALEEIELAVNRANKEKAA